MAPEIGTRTAVEVIAATSTTGTPPVDATDGYIFSSGNYTANVPSVRTFIDYTGTVTSCELRLYVRTLGSDAWYAAASTEDLDALTPAGGDEVRDWDIGANTECRWVVETIAGGGTVTVEALGVER